MIQIDTMILISHTYEKLAYLFNRWWDETIAKSYLYLVVVFSLIYRFKTRYLDQWKNEILSRKLASRQGPPRSSSNSPQKNDNLSQEHETTAAVKNLLKLILTRKRLAKNTANAAVILAACRFNLWEDMWDFLPKEVLRKTIKIKERIEFYTDFFTLTK